VVKENIVKDPIHSAQGGDCWPVAVMEGGDRIQTPVRTRNGPRLENNEVSKFTGRGPSAGP